MLLSSFHLNAWTHWDFQKFKRFLKLSVGIQGNIIVDHLTGDTLRSGSIFVSLGKTGHFCASDRALTYEKMRALIKFGLIAG